MSQDFSTLNIFVIICPDKKPWITKRDRTSFFDQGDIGTVFVSVKKKQALHMMTSFAKTALNNLTALQLCPVWLQY